MKDITKTLLKERSKLTKYFYRNGRKDHDHNRIFKKWAECTRGVPEAKKKNFIIKKSNKLEGTNSSPKIYWTILNGWLYNKKIPLIASLLVVGKVVSNFNDKSYLLTIFFFFFCINI